MKKILLLFTIFSIAIGVYSQSYADVRANQILDSRGEIVFTFKASPEEIGSFAKIMSIDKYNGKDVIAYANRSEFDKFLTSGKDFDIYNEYYSEKSLSMATTVSEMASWDRYPTYEVYIEMMQSFAQDFPAICKLDTIGYSYEGRLLLVVKISDNVNQEEAEPEFLYTGMMHGDELVAGMMFLHLIDHLLSEYGTNSQITELIDNIQIYINPFSNPDGTYSGGNSTVADATRTNGENIDMNRNYPDFIAGQNPDGNATAIETQLMIDYAASRNFVMSVNSHSGAELLNYPYDTESILPADDDWWVLVCNDYADLAHENSSSDYLTDEGGGVSNGYAWYTATGTRQDYMNYYELCREVTLELSSAKLLDSEELPNHWNYNRDAMLSYLEHVSYGLKGIVTDSLTNESLEALVFIDGHDMINSHVYSFPLHGDYYRPIYEGNYSATYSCEGYRSKTFDVNITNYQQTIQNVQLVKLIDLPPRVDFISNIQDIECNPEVNFINTSEASESTTYFWEFGDGTNSVEVNPSHTYHENGTYTVKLFAENEHGSDSLWKASYISVNLNEMSDIQDYVICESEGSVAIDISGNGEIFWYYNMNDEFEFQTGESFTTPTLSESTTYFIQDFIQGEQFTGGEFDNSEGGTFMDNNNYLVFDCLEECTLETVKVYAEGDGTRTIYLKNSQGENLYSEDFVIEDGEQILALNFIIPVGTEYKLGCANPQGLYRGASGIVNTFSYPFDIGGKISITESNVVWWNDSEHYYAYFYDWKITMPDCVSERTPVNVFVNEIVDAQFDYSVNLSTVSFENTSVGADNYLWDFGDEYTSSEVNPEHTYATDGTYTVNLTASSDCGSDFYEQEILVTTGISREIKSLISINPNPVSNLLNISAKGNIQKIEIIDLRGRTILLQENIITNNCQLDVSELNNGMYLLKVYSENDIYLDKIIKK